MSREIKTPGPDHPITIEKNPARVVVRVGDKVVADTTAALALREGDYPAVQYIPLGDVDAAALEDSTTSSYCPYKGDASYFSLVTADGEEADAVWTYREPYPAVAEIAGHVAFYPGKVEVAES